jgi:hypothetical protein
MHNLHHQTSTMLPRQQQPHSNLLHELPQLRSQHNYPRPTLRYSTHPPPTKIKKSTTYQLTPSQICPPTTLPGTTTITACSASPTCTKTVTSTSPFGCTITVPPKIRTQEIECGGCELETVTVAHSFVGIGPVCVDGRTTVTGSTGRATVTACAVAEK